MSKYRIISHTVPASYIREYPRALANSQEDQLYLSLKQYVPLSNPNPKPGDVTIIAAHANGFAKELYEPLWDDLLSKLEASNHPFRIRAIWIADAAHQNQSYVLNEGKLGNDPGWFDHARDLAHLINLFRREMPRPIVGIGHSMGGTHLVNVALWHPRLFTSLVLLEPVIHPWTTRAQWSEKPEPHIAVYSTYRRDVWPSRDEARRLFARSPYYAAWDQRVLERWVEHGLRDCPTLLRPDDAAPAVTLTTPPAQEVFTFVRPNFERYGAASGKPVDRSTHADLDPGNEKAAPFYRSEPVRTLARVEEISPGVLLVFGGTSNALKPEAARTLLQRTGTGIGGSGGEKEGRVKLVTLDKVGHLIAQEAPAKTAELAAGWIAGELERWREQERDLQRDWYPRSAREKQEIGEEWKRQMGSPPRPAKKDKDSKI